MTMMMTTDDDDDDDNNNDDDNNDDDDDNEKELSEIDAFRAQVFREQSIQCKGNAFPKLYLFCLLHEVEIVTSGLDKAIISALLYEGLGRYQIPSSLFHSILSSYCRKYAPH
ncbi:unnamed protein product [Wuchereria bancrofti]|uniref:Uncharacterized protein n=1 Tax=Wuchereria bancrofti TaxID=6293 RepID=A0A3P7EC60_WUCBA|nr:unnamed protein product [Wuchereria bancrofti]